MGQAVSYILESICDEAEEGRRSNEQKLQTSRIIQWVNSLKSILGEAEEEKRSNKQKLQTSPIIQWVNSLKSIWGEAEEEKRSNMQKLLTSPIIQWVNSLNCLHFVLFSMALLAIKSYSCSNSKTTSDHTSRLVSPPSLLSCIDSSTANNNNNVVKRRFKFYHSSILVVGNIDSSISSSSTSGTLLHEVFDDTLNDFSRIDSSTDEALLHELCVALSSYAPSTDMSSDQALFHEPFVGHSTYVASIDSSTDEALLPKLTTTPSAVFRSIDQFKVTDLNIQVVEDKMQVHLPNNENVKTTKARSGEECKEAKPRRAAALPVVIERKIKHYSSSQKILLVGEGDFSFSACLARTFGSASNIVATSLDFTEFLKANYKNAVSNICELKSRGAKVMHGVDATGMACNCLLNGSVYDRIIYNFPLAGFFPDASKKMELKRNRRLILKFLENAKKLISADGEIHISHKSWGFFLEWNLPLLASQVGLQLIEEVPFDLKDYRGYNTKFGFGGDNNFNCNPSKTYKFGHKLKK